MTPAPQFDHSHRVVPILAVRFLCLLAAMSMTVACQRAVECAEPVAPVVADDNPADADHAASTDDQRSESTDAAVRPADAPTRQSAPYRVVDGVPFWGDLQFCHGWRIQRDSLTGTCRLIDGEYFCYATGRREQCEQRLQEIRKQRQLGPMRGEAVVLIHGLIRSSREMQRFTEACENAGYLPVPFTYPSTRITIPEAGRMLHDVIAGLEGVTRVHIVAHSMGGIVTRSYCQQFDEPRLGRIVMLGVPNNGAELAEVLRYNVWLRWLMGPGAVELRVDPQGLVSRLPAPPTEFATIAGARLDGQGWNPILPGDDDGTVTVARAHLAGATDSINIPVMHPLLTRDPGVIELTLRFLATGALRDNGLREPVPVAITLDTESATGPSTPANKSANETVLPPTLAPDRP